VPTMSAADLIAELRERGHVVGLQGAQVAIRPSPDKATIERLRARRDELAAYLCAQNDAALVDAAAVVAAKVATSLWDVARPVVGALGWTADGKVCRGCGRLDVVRRCDFVCKDCLR